MKLIQSKKYRQAVAKLVISDERLKNKILGVYKRLEENLFDPQLKTHKLKGELEGCWSCSVTYDISIVFEIKNDKEGKILELLAIGSHDEVY